MVDVPDVELQAFAPVHRIAPVDLSPAGDAGPDLVATGLTGIVPLEVLHEQRPRPDQAHIPPEDIQELRQLVDARRAEKAPQGGQALLVRKRASVRVAGVSHRAKLQDGKRPPVQTGAGLPKKDGAPHRKAYQGGHGEHR